MQSPQRSISVLCLDVGSAGVHVGLVQIKIIRDLMKEVLIQRNGAGANEPSETDIDQMRPSDYFDVIYGGGMGGALAAYLGRLHLTIKKCEEYYQQLGDKVYGIPVFFLNPFQRYNYDHTRLERLLQTQTTCDSKVLDFADKSIGCKAVLLTRSTHNPQFVSPIESYKAEPGKIWQAVRATTAVFFDFPSIKVARYHVISPEAGSSNPSKFAWDLLVKMYSPAINRRVSHPATRGICLVSIGGGVPSTVKLHVNRGPGPKWYGWWLYWSTKLCHVLILLAMGLFGKLTRLPQIQSLEDLARGPESVHYKLLKVFNDQKNFNLYFYYNRSGYYRFNFNPKQDLAEDHTPGSALAMLCRRFSALILGLENLFTGRQTLKGWDESKSSAKRVTYTSHDFGKHIPPGTDLDVKTTGDLASVATQLIHNMRDTT